MARVLFVDRQHPDPRVLAEAAAVIAAGGLVAFPTETVYGLGASALDPHAVARVYAAKGRPTHHPLIAHLPSEFEARALAARWPLAASALARALWPGPLTLVVERAADVPPSVSGGSTSIAVRVPSHPVARGFLAAAGVPVAAPSANRYQGLSPTTAAHVVEQLGDDVDVVLDAGPCDAGIESTVVDVRAHPARVLRPGALDLASLRSVAPDLVFDAGAPAPSAERASPGMDARHYAPRARLVLAADAREGFDRAARIAERDARGAGLVTHAAVSGNAACSGRVLVRTMSPDPVLYARSLYATLHELDAEKVAAIVVVRVPSGEGWWAIVDRLSRGATQPV